MIPSVLSLLGFGAGPVVAPVVKSPTTPILYIDFEQQIVYAEDESQQIYLDPD